MHRMDRHNSIFSIYFHFGSLNFAFVVVVVIVIFVVLSLPLYEASRVFNLCDRVRMCVWMLNVDIIFGLKLM